MGGETFDWWYDGNPAGSLRSVALAGRAGRRRGRAQPRIGCRSTARERLGQFSVHAVTAPEARGLGIFRALELRHEEQGKERGSACVLAFASEPTRPLFLGPLGWTQIDRRRIWARPLPRGPRGRPVERFGARHDAVSTSVARRLGNHVTRSSEYLNWRYLDASREYRAVESEGGGYAVVGFTRKRGRRVALLMELVAEPGDFGVLLGNALAEAHGTVALLAVPSPVLTRPTARPPRLRADAVSARLHGQGARGAAGRAAGGVDRLVRGYGLPLIVAGESSSSRSRSTPSTRRSRPRCPKIRALAALVDEVVVLADGAVPGVLPANCRVRTFRSSTKAGRGARFEAALARELGGLRGGAVVAHMCPIYAVLAAPLVRPLGVPLVLWFTHWKASRLLRAAERVSTAVVSVDERSFPLESEKVRAIGHGIDVSEFSCVVAAPAGSACWRSGATRRRRVSAR